MLSDENPSFQESVRKVFSEANGLLYVVVIRPADQVPMMLAAIDGDTEALRFSMATMRGRQNIRAMAKKKPAICLCCPKIVKDIGATQAFLMAVNAATVALATTVCAKCSTGTTDEVHKRVAQGFQAAWPGLRCVEVTHADGGRA